MSKTKKNTSRGCLADTPIIISREALDAVNASQMAPREVPTIKPHENKIKRIMPAGFFGGHVEVSGTEDEWRAFDAKQRREDMAVALLTIAGVAVILAMFFR